MVDTIIISDLHLSRKDSNIDEFLQFIIENPSKTLVLNGDIFDQFAYFRDRGKIYRGEHKQIVKKIRGILKKRGTKVIYLIGNHDYLAFLFIPFGFLFRMKIRKRIIRNNVIIEHGDWISLWLNLRKIKKTTYHENCIAFAKAKNKKLVVGHSHHPEYMPINDWVHDEGDWTVHNTHLVLEEWI